VGVIACDIFGSHPTISIVHAKVCKPHVAVEGIVVYMGIKNFKSSVLDEHAYANQKSSSSS
jgi:hypothetical protein